MRNLLRRQYNARKIYHFTDQRNLETIRALGGIYPRCQLQNTPFIPGGNQWSIDADDRVGMDRYVHCCFLQQHPMQYRAIQEGRIDPVWLEVATDVLDFEGVLYSPGVANSAGMTFFDNDEAREELDLFALYRYLDWSIPANHERRQTAEKYEILVPSIIPIDYIGGRQWH